MLALLACEIPIEAKVPLLIVLPKKVAKAMRNLKQTEIPLLVATCSCVGLDAVLNVKPSLNLAVGRVALICR